MTERSSTSSETFLQQAVEIVAAAAEIARRGFGTSPIIQTKALSDIVTEADREVEEYVVSHLAKLYPDHGFFCEESGKRSADAEYVWILDPIDGTKYYARGVPLYSIALSLERRGRPLLGIVHNPQTNEVFCGAAGRGATLNGRPIRCSEATLLDESTLCVEIPSRDLPEAQRRLGLEEMGILVDHVRRVRILGVGALGLCYCASGGFDAYVNLRSGTTKYWDIAAGRAILEAAGGRFFHADEQIVAGPAELCRQLQELLGFEKRP